MTEDGDDHGPEPDAGAVGDLEHLAEQVGEGAVPTDDDGEVEGFGLGGLPGGKGGVGPALDLGAGLVSKPPRGTTSPPLDCPIRDDE